MTLKVRKLKEYHQRRSSKVMRPLKDSLHNLEVKLQADMVRFLAALQQGSESNTSALSNEIRNNLQKYGPEMQRIADEIGATFPKRVSVFLSSIEQLVNTSPSPQGIKSPVESTKIQSCQRAARQLEELLAK